MALYDVYRYPIRQHHRAAVLSGASCFQLITIAITIVCPWLIAYRSHGFWIKTDSYREQPEVHFKHEFAIVLQGTTLDSYYLWSTYPTLNRLSGTHQRVSTVSSREIDDNRDGRPDRLHIRVHTPVSDRDPIHSVQAFVILDYKLVMQSRYQMETAVFIDETSIRPVKRLHISGDLHLQQRVPLWYSGRDNRYDHRIINDQRLRADSYVWSELVQSYMSRNLTTTLQPATRSWQPTAVIDNSDTQSYFELAIDIRIVEQSIEYYTGFWQLMKWAWVQYLSVLVIFVLLMAKLREMVFRTHMLATVPQPIALTLTSGGGNK